MEKKDDKMPAKDTVFSIALIIFGIYIIITSLGLKYQTTFIDGAGFFPLIIGIVLVVLGAVLLYVGISCGGISQLRELANGSTILNFIKSDSTVRVVILLLMMVIYVYVLLGRIHFIASTSIYLFCNFMYLQSCKKWHAIPGPVVAALISIITAAVIYFGMMYGLGITLP